MSTTASFNGDFALLKPSPSSWTGLRRLAGTLTLAAASGPRLRPPQKLNIRSSLSKKWSFPPNVSPPRIRPQDLDLLPSGAVAAGRSKKKPGGPSSGRIEGNAEVRRRAKGAAKKRSRRMAENLFYRHSKTWGEEADSFTEEELQMIGLGYDRSVRFMEKDDPKLKHPHDWYKYGKYGPYSWRGIVVGSPIRGRFSDERVSMIGEVRDHEDWEEIEQHEMSMDFSRRIESMGESCLGFRYFWVFVRHPKWRGSDPPWQQWTLVAEVAVDAEKNQRIDKWNLMARLGNSTRSLITKCAAWFRPDIIYVRRPVYQCRFEPQDNFFKLLIPLMDPDTEDQFPCELKNAKGEIETCNYFAGLCKIIGISSKSFVDEVVQAYQKLNEEEKKRCLEFLLKNHPMELLHPYTREWKARLEEMELGCDAPDHSDEEMGEDSEIVDWIEEEADGEDAVIDMEEEDDEEEEEEEDEEEEENSDPAESEEFWNEQWKKALKDSAAMEGLVKKSIEISNQVYENQIEEEERESWGNEQSPETMPEFSPAPVKTAELRSDPRRKTKTGRIPPELFLRAGVRPFTYRNLVKEIVLLRHAILDKEIAQ